MPTLSKAGLQCVYIPPFLLGLTSMFKCLQEDDVDIESKRLGCGSWWQPCKRLPTLQKSGLHISFFVKSTSLSCNVK